MDNFRKPYPMKIVDSDDERVSIRDDLTIEFAGKTMDIKRARKLSEWLFAATDWIEAERKIQNLPKRNRRAGRIKTGKESE